VLIDVSEESISSIFRVEEKRKTASEESAWADADVTWGIDPLLGNASLNTFPRKEILGKQPVTV
jgi:hypothetical protein